MQIPPSSPPEAIMIDDAEEENNGMPFAPPQDDSMMIDDSIQQISPGFGFMKSLGLGGGLGGSGLGSSRFDSPRGNKRSRGGGVLRSNQHEPRRIEGLDVAGYAKGFAASARQPQLKDPDDVVLDTELLTEPLIAALKERTGAEEVADLARELMQLWKRYGALSKEEAESEEIGPGSRSSGMKRANMLASLLLTMHIPQLENGQPVPLPKVLLDWLDHNHDPSSTVLEEALSQKKHGYYAAPGFWDAIYLGLNRGRFSTVIQLLQGAKFEDNVEQELDERQAEGIQVAIQAAIRLLQQCPAVASQNWDVKGSDWTLWRHQVESASDDLREYAEEDAGNNSASLWGSALGRSDALAMSARSRRVESNVPFEIYEPLQDMYSQLKGTSADILKSCFDWLEAVVTLTVWWDGSEERSSGNSKGSLAASASRQSVSKRHHHHQTREVDLNPLHAYRAQLASSLVLAMAEEDVREGLDVTNELHLGLACVVLDDPEHAVELCKNWSMPIAASITELATAGQWMSSGSSRGTIENFDKSDLMVLSYGQPEQQSSVKDRILELYAGLLASKERFTSTTSDISMEGWEMAMRVLGRLDDVEKAQAKVTELLEKVPLTDRERIDNVLMLCNDLGFGSHATHISEVRIASHCSLSFLADWLTQEIQQRYADTLTDSTHAYGSALLYYLRAHSYPKAKKVLDVLITSSLIQSRAYPSHDKLDDRMREFIERPKETLSVLAATDLEAAQKLGGWLSGYATLRRFYEVRDSGNKGGSGELRRKKEAVTALLAVLASAADPIRGGLFDASTEVVVPVEAVLVLLGETLPLLRESPGVFSQAQLFAILRVVEDLQTVGPRIFKLNEALFGLAVENAFGQDTPSARAMLRKETSGMTGSSQFSLVGSSLLNASREDAKMEESRESGMMVEKPEGESRGWDWRKGLKRTSKASEVLQVLRLVVAERVADAWSEV